MTYTKPKIYIPVVESIFNLLAIFSLILHVFNPGMAIAASSTWETAVVSQETVAASLATVETALSEDPGAKLLNAVVTPDAVYKGVVTAYTSTPGQTDDTPFIAATGKHVYDGMIASNNLPFGTRVVIRSVYGDKVFTVDDRMNKRYSCAPNHCRMDVWLDTSRSEARKLASST
jgi:hypothetical protein